MKGKENETRMKNCEESEYDPETKAFQKKNARNDS